MNCPKCNYPQVCPCETCSKNRTSDRLKPWIWIADELIKCADCGFTASVDEWEKFEYDHYMLAETIKQER
jgi:hypothetical protein